MTGPWIALAVVALLLALVTAALAWTSVRRARAELAETRAESAAIRERLGELDARLRRATAHPEPDSKPEPGASEFVITGVGAADDRADDRDPIPQPDGRLFTDLVVRESIVKAAALTYGVRRALSPATRHRIRFEMRQEVQAARKQRRATRKAELRAARRLLREAETAGADADEAEDAA